MWNNSPDSLVRTDDIDDCAVTRAVFHAILDTLFLEYTVKL